MIGPKSGMISIRMPTQSTNIPRKITMPIMIQITTHLFSPVPTSIALTKSPPPTMM